MVVTFVCGKASIKLAMIGLIAVGAMITIIKHKIASLICFLFPLFSIFDCSFKKDCLQ